MATRTENPLHAKLCELLGIRSPICQPGGGS